MSRQIQIRRGTASEHEDFTGAIGEITMDTTNNTLRVHDGETVGGTVLAKKSEIPSDIMIADYVTESWRAEDGSSWYRKYKSGWVEQGGWYTGNSKTVNLPVSVTDTNYSVIICKNSSPSYWATTNLCVSTKTKTSFTVSKYGDSASLTVCWEILNALYV